MNTAELLEQIDVLQEENRQLREHLGFVTPDLFLVGCKQVFGLTPSEARIFHAICFTRTGSRESIWLAYADGLPCEADPRGMDVMIFRIRKKIAHYGLTIVTLWGHGFRMGDGDKELLTKLLGQEAMQ